MPWEFAVLNWFQSVRGAAGDAVMPLVSALGNHGAVWVLLVVVLLVYRKTRYKGCVLLLALLLDYLLCNGIIKPLVNRIRPYEVNTAIQLIAVKPKDASFPSGHTAAAFSAVSAMYFSKSRLFLPVLLLAAVIAISRLYLYMHFPTDVFCGMLLGIFCGWLGKTAADYLTKKLASKKKNTGDDSVC